MPSHLLWSRGSEEKKKRKKTRPCPSRFLASFPPFPPFTFPSLSFSLSFILGFIMYRLRIYNSPRLTQSSAVFQRLHATDISPGFLIFLTENLSASFKIVCQESVDYNRNKTTSNLRKKNWGCLFLPQMGISPCHRPSAPQVMVGFLAGREQQTFL